jgi:hypothetical protein
MQHSKFCHQQHMSPWLLHIIRPLLCAMANFKPQHHVSSHFSHKLKPESLVVQSKYYEFVLFLDMMHYSCFLYEIDTDIMLVCRLVFMFMSKTAGFLLMTFYASESMLKGVQLI